jgi:hypothetical protein
MNIRDEPFLWIHLAGVALFPASIVLTLIALGIGDSFPYFIELPLLAAIAILPILLMQLTRPFDIFSVLIFSLKPESLTEQQRQILSFFQTLKHKAISVIAAIFMLLVLWSIYRLSPLVIGIVAFLPQWRILGLAIAATSFFFSNLFLQVPLSVLQVLTLKNSKLTHLEPYLLEKIERDFTVPGIKVSKILWFLESPSEVDKIA